MEAADETKPLPLPSGVMLGWRSPPYNKGAVQAKSVRGNWEVRTTSNSSQSVLCFDTKDADGNPTMPVPVGTFGSIVEGMIAAQCIHARIGQGNGVDGRQDLRRMSWLGHEDTLVRQTSKGTFMLIDEGYSTGLVFVRNQKLETLGSLRFRSREYRLPGKDGSPARNDELKLIELAALVEIMDFRLTLGHGREASRLSAAEWDQWLDTRFIPVASAEYRPDDDGAGCRMQMEMSP